MRSMQTLNLGPKASASVSPDTAPPGEMAEMGALIEQTRSELRRTQIQMDRQDDAQHSHERRTRILAIATGLLLVLVLASAWLAYPSLRDQKRAIGELLGLQSLVGTLGQRVNAVEGTYEKTTAVLSGVGDRIQQLQANMNAGLQAAANQARAMARQTGDQIRADVNRSIQPMQSRLDGVESGQRESIEHVSQLEQQVVGLQRELASMKQETSAANDKIKALEEDQRVRTAAMSSLGQQLAAAQTAVTGLAGQVDRKRIEFQVDSRQTQQIAPGLYLTVTRADAGKQQIDARLQIASESRVLPIRGQELHKALRFYTGGDNRPVEMVVTSVARNRVTGYMLVPVAQVAQ
jgi:chromosome segregation ATPase